MSPGILVHAGCRQFSTTPVVPEQLGRLEDHAVDGMLQFQDGETMQLFSDPSGTAGTIRQFLKHWSHPTLLSSGSSKAALVNGFTKVCLACSTVAGSPCLAMCLLDQQHLIIYTLPCTKCSHGTAMLWALMLSNAPPRSPLQVSASCFLLSRASFIHMAMM